MSLVLDSVFREFPEGSIHLVALHSDSNLKEPYIAAKLEGHFFIGQNNAWPISLNFHFCEYGITCHS